MHPLAFRLKRRWELWLKTRQKALAHRRPRIGQVLFRFPAAFGYIYGGSQQCMILTPHISHKELVSSETSSYYYPLSIIIIQRQDLV